MYRFYLDGVLMPVTPGKISTKIKNTNKTISLLGYDVNLLKTPGLTQISFETVLPTGRYPFSIYDHGFFPATYFLSKIEGLKVNKAPFTFIVSKVLPDGDIRTGINMMVSLEDYTITEDVLKYGQDMGIKIKLKQYRHFGTKVLSLSEDGLTATIGETRQSKQPEQYYTVKGNETVYDIAKRETGDGENYANIMSLNNLASIFDIDVGQVITLG